MSERPKRRKGPRAGDLIAGRYRIVAEIGRGAMGVVYEVEHTKTTERLALKVISGADGSSFLTRFRREASMWARMPSDHIVRIVDADETDVVGGPFIEGDESGRIAFVAMELLKGRDVEELIRAWEGASETYRIPPEDVLAILEQVARGLDLAHAAAVVHRDLKPSNLFLHKVGDRYVVKILDFGLAKVLDADVTAVTKTGAILGTPLYMAPEQVRAEATQVGPPADIWAIGMVTVEMLTGCSYWENSSVIGVVLMRIAAGVGYPPSERWPWLPKSFDAWFKKSCNPDPTQRFTCVGDQVRALREALAVTPSARIAEPSGRAASKRTTATEKPAPSRGGGGWILVLAALAALGAGGGVAAVLLWPREPPAPPSPRSGASAGRPAGSNDAASSDVSREDDGVDGGSPATLDAMPPKAATADAATAEAATADAGSPALDAAASRDGEEAPSRSAVTPAASSVRDPGYLTFTAFPWVHVAENGRRICTTPCYRAALSPGSHTLTLDNPDQEFHRVIAVTITSGEVTTKSLALQK